MAKTETRAVLDNETQLLHEIRAERLQERQAKLQGQEIPLSAGQKVADWVATGMGSWPFIIVQSTLLFFWILLNLAAWIHHWDPYPFILLNLALSFQAAYAAPFIMMSQNRQSDIDRKKAEQDYRINIKAELEIELLHHKLDELREREVLALSESINRLSGLLERK